MAQLQAFSGSPIKASNMIGSDVINLKDENIGDIKEVVIDPATGKVAYAVVSFGGFLSVGEKLFAIPFHALEYNADKGKYVLDIEKQRLEDAPGFNANQWPTFSDEKWSRGVHQYYRSRPYWE